ncbi:Contactin-3, partial [Dissostichus eleginoides]
GLFFRMKIHSCLQSVLPKCLSIRACTEDVILQGPRWRTEPTDLILPIDSPDQQATITCEAEGSPPPQYRSQGVHSEHAQISLRLQHRSTLFSGIYCKLPPPDVVLDGVYDSVVAVLATEEGGGLLIVSVVQRHHHTPPAVYTNAV